MNAGPAVWSLGVEELDSFVEWRSRSCEGTFWGRRNNMSVSTAQAAVIAAANRPMTSDEKKIILASSLGTVFEWYDFYLYGSLAVIIGAKFFGQFDENTRNIFALLAFAAGFLV